MTDTLVTTLRSYADREREHAENNRVVAELLQPQVDLFDDRYRENCPAHNTYAVRMAIDHRSSAARDETFADELNLAADTLESLNARVRDLQQARDELEERLMTLIKTRNLLGKYMCGEPCCKDISND